MEVRCDHIITHLWTGRHGQGWMQHSYPLPNTRQYIHVTTGSLWSMASTGLHQLCEISQASPPQLLFGRCGNEASRDPPCWPWRGGTCPTWTWTQWWSQSSGHTPVGGDGGTMTLILVVSQHTQQTMVFPWLIDGFPLSSSFMYILIFPWLV